MRPAPAPRTAHSGWTACVSGVTGFCNRATHNLWVLLREAEAVRARLADGTYRDWYTGHLDNSTYLPLIQQALAQIARSS